jgi:hypothetical protein
MTKENNSKNYTELTVRVKYDSYSDQISFTSKDESIKGEPFYMTLRSGTSTYDTMMDLLRREGVVERESDNTLRTNLLKKMTLRAPSNSIAKDKVRLGVDIMGDDVFLNINPSENNASNGVSIIGKPGSGKSILIENYLHHAENTEGVKAVYLDCKNEKELEKTIETYKKSESVTIVSEQSNFFSVIEETLESKAKDEILLICLDYESLLLSNSEDISPIAFSSLKHLFRTSRSLGIYFIISFQSENYSKFDFGVLSKITFEDNSLARIKNKSHLFKPYTVEKN